MFILFRRQNGFMIFYDFLKSFINTAAQVVTLVTGSHADSVYFPNILGESNGSNDWHQASQNHGNYIFFKIQEYKSQTT